MPEKTALCHSVSGRSPFETQEGVVSDHSIQEKQTSQGNAHGSGLFTLHFAEITKHFPILSLVLDDLPGAFQEAHV